MRRAQAAALATRMKRFASPASKRPGWLPVSVMSFAGKVIVITGASEGIGAELARQLAPEKPKLVLAARRLDVHGSGEQSQNAGGDRTD